MRSNLLLNTDSYKTSHFLQYPPHSQVVSSYIESRGGRYPNVVFFGLQAFIGQYLLRPISQDDVALAELVINNHGLPFNRKGWQYILQKHKGFLPVRIEAVAEGTPVPTQNVLVQIHNTDDNCAWLTSYLETALLRAVWYPTTVATVSYHCKKIIKEYLEKTADSLDGLPFKLHDFGARGATSEESASIGGLAHLVNFMGTDTLSCLELAREYYFTEAGTAGFSIPAAEHSTITSWGRDNERAAYENMLNQFAGEAKTVAVVSDSYNLWHAIDEIWGVELKERVESSGGTLVIRPDSGNPVDVVLKTVEKLMNVFGYQTNKKGYRVLPDYVRVIQGDGVDENSIQAILHHLADHNISADNVAFGMGASLLQRIDRDTQQFAMKASAIKVNNEWRDVFKDPITDKNKRSKKGRLALIQDEQGQFQTIRMEALDGRKNHLLPVYENGKWLKGYPLLEVRKNAAL